MKENLLFLILYIVILTSSCNILKRENATDNEIYAFVGEKISVKEIKSNTLKLRFIDNNKDTLFKKRIAYEKRFLAKYLVNKNIYNSIHKDTVEFVTFNENGEIPNFINDKFTLFFIAKTADGILYTPGGNYTRITKKRKKFFTLSGESINSVVFSKLDSIIKFKNDMR